MGQSVTAKGLRRRHTLIIFLYTLCSLLLVSWFLVGWRVKDITVIGCQRLSPEAITQRSDHVLGRHIFGFDEKALIASLSEESPYVKSVTLRRHLPNRLEIAVTEYIPAGYTEKDGVFTVISPSLVPLAKCPTEKEAASIVPRKIILPENASTEPFSYSDQTASRIRNVLEALLDASAEKLILADLSDLYAIHAESADGISVSFGSDRELSAKLKAAANVLSYLEANGNGKAGTVYVTEKGTASFVSAQ